MSHPSADLTRWNRAGLRRIRYVDGNVVTWLELLRERLIEHFTDEVGDLKWRDLVDLIEQRAQESGDERRARLLAQYYAPRRDFAWEILRAFARSTHVLTEHLDAYANESYLRTATQWDNVRRLVAMLDYHPAPPASASTWLAVHAKPDRSGTLSAGFKVKNKPDDGSAPIVFETLAELAVDASVNSVRAFAWNKSQIPIRYAPCKDGKGFCAAFPLSIDAPTLSKGEIGLLIAVHDDGAVNAAGVQVDAVSTTEVGLRGGVPATPPAISALRYQVSLFVDAQFIEQPRLAGENVISVESGHGLVRDDIVAWLSGNWQIARVLGVDGQRIELSRAVPAPGVALYRLLGSHEQSIVDVGGGVAKKRVVLPLDRDADGNVWDRDLLLVNSLLEIEDDSEGRDLYTFIAGTSRAEAYYLPADSKAVTTVLQSEPQTLEFDGTPGKLASGQWLVMDAGGELLTRQIDAVLSGEDSFELLLTEPVAVHKFIVYGLFQSELRPAEHGRNDADVSVSHTATHSTIALETLPQVLQPGRSLIVANAQDSALVSIVAVDESLNRISVSPSIGAQGTAEPRFRRYDTVIYGNVVMAGHGETRPQKILGSGDATLSEQRFVLPASQVSFVADATQSAGVAAAMDVYVGSQRWTQVSSLSVSQPEDAHYIVRMQEDGTVSIRFGDGEHGRRVPSGVNNVRVSYRTGVGLSGNLARNALTKPVKPHALIESVCQPLPATGGNDMENVESLREFAPASVLTLGRAVALTDFANLARSHASVWQANAHRLPPGRARGERVEVVVVPAGGGALGELGDTLRGFLSTNAGPGIAISVVNYRALIFSLDVVVRIDIDAYDPTVVAEQVHSTLLSTFSIERRGLGEPLYRSSVFAAVESVTGVKNCECVIDDHLVGSDGLPTHAAHVAYGSDARVRSIRADGAQLIYLDLTRSNVAVKTEAFEL